MPALPGLAGGESGKEILYPVATVIVGGLISSTLDFFVHPALFWSLGRKEAQRLADEPEEDFHWGDAWEYAAP